MWFMYQIVFYDTIFEAHYVIVDNVMVLVSRGQLLRPLSILKNKIKPIK